MELSVQVSEQQATCKTLTDENNQLKKKIDEVSKKDFKGKSEGSKIQFKLEEELTNAKDDLSTSIDRNSLLEEEQTKVKTKFEKALKWTVKSKNVFSYTQYRENDHSKYKCSFKNTTLKGRRSSTILKRRR